MAVDFSALLRAEVRDQGQKLSEWKGELGGQSVTLYSKPLTPADNHQVLGKYPNFNNSFDMGGMVLYIVLKAQDEDGNLVFSAKDTPVLMRMGQDKIQEIFGGLFGTFIEEIEDEDTAEAKHEDRVKN